MSEDDEVSRSLDALILRYCANRNKYPRGSSEWDYFERMMMFLRHARLEWQNLRSEPAGKETK